MTEVEIIVDGPMDAPLLLLAHGAGAHCQSPFMTAMSELLALRGIRTARFDFDYMASRRLNGKRRPPPRTDKLIPQFQRAISIAAAIAGNHPLFIGGKSMGGRIASLIADVEHTAARIAGCVCLGYPFHPSKKPLQLRTAHLLDMSCPLLIAQGDRDPLGNKDEVASYELSPAIEFVWLKDGDHDLKPRRAAGLTHRDNMETAATAIANFVARNAPSQ